MAHANFTRSKKFGPLIFALQREPTSRRVFSIARSIEYDVTNAKSQAKFPLLNEAIREVFQQSKEATTKSTSNHLAKLLGELKNIGRGLNGFMWFLAMRNVLKLAKNDFIYSTEPETDAFVANLRFLNEGVRLELLEPDCYFDYALHFSMSSKESHFVPFIFEILRNLDGEMATNAIRLKRKHDELFKSYTCFLAGIIDRAMASSPQSSDDLQKMSDFVNSLGLQYNHRHGPDCADRAAGSPKNRKKAPRRPPQQNGFENDMAKLTPSLEREPSESVCRLAGDLVRHLSQSTSAKDFYGKTWAIFDKMSEPKPLPSSYATLLRKLSSARYSHGDMRNIANSWVQRLHGKAKSEISKDDYRIVRFSFELVKYRLTTLKLLMAITSKVDSGPNSKTAKLVWLYKMQKHAYALFVSGHLPFNNSELLFWNRLHHRLKAATRNSNTNSTAVPKLWRIVDFLRSVEQDGGWLRSEKLASSSGDLRAILSPKQRSWTSPPEPCYEPDAKTYDHQPSPPLPCSSAEMQQPEMSEVNPYISWSKSTETVASDSRVDTPVESQQEGACSTDMSISTMDEGEAAAAVEEASASTSRDTANGAEAMVNGEVASGGDDGTYADDESDDSESELAASIEFLKERFMSLPADSFSENVASIVDSILPKIGSDIPLDWTPRLFAELGSVSSIDGNSFIFEMQEYLLHLLINFDTELSTIQMDDVWAYDSSLKSVLQRRSIEMENDFLKKYSGSIRLVGRLCATGVLSLPFALSFLERLLETKHAELFFDMLDMMESMAVLGSDLDWQAVASDLAVHISAFWDKIADIRDRRRETFCPGSLRLSSCDDTFLLQAISREILISRKDGFPPISSSESFKRRLRILLDNVAASQSEQDITKATNRIRVFLNNNNNNNNNLPRTDDSSADSFMAEVFLAKLEEMIKARLEI